MLEIILVQGFRPLESKITQFPNGFRLKGLSHVTLQFVTHLHALHFFIFKCLTSCTKQRHSLYIKVSYKFNSPQLPSIKLNCLCPREEGL